MSTTPRTPYKYVVLRYVHDIATGEFMNVGVVVFAPDSGKALAKFKLAYGRLKKAFPTLDAEVFRSRMRRLQSIFDAAEKGELDSAFLWPRGQCGSIEELAHAVLRQDDSSLQWSPLGSGLAKDLRATLTSLYERFVAKYDAEVSHVTRKDEDVWKHFRLALERRNVLDYLEEKVIAVHDDAVKFGHAWQNGAWHCYEPLSFDLASESSIKEKAHRWLGQVSSIKGASEKFAVYFLVGKPSDATLSEAYEQAVSILRKAPDSNVIEEAMAEQFSDKVAQDIAEHVARTH